MMNYPFRFDGAAGSTAVVSVGHDPTTLLDFCLNFDLEAALSTETHLHSLAADLHVHRGGKDWRIGAMELRSRLPPYRLKDGQVARWGFRIPLSARQLQAIDEARNDDDVEFRVEVTITYAYPTGPDGLVTHETLVGSASPRYRIAQSDWAKRLRAMGAADVLIFAVQIPPDRPDIAKIVKHLREAQAELLAGRRPPDVATSVRKALECFEEWQDDKQQVNDAGNAGFANLRGTSIDHRLRLARRAIHALVAASAHDSIVEYDIPTARASVGMAIALLEAYVERGTSRT